MIERRFKLLVMIPQGPGLGEAQAPGDDLAV